MTATRPGQDGAEASTDNEYLRQLGVEPRAGFGVVVDFHIIAHAVIGCVKTRLEIEPGVEGLIHISEMTWSRRMKHPSKVVKAGDQVEAVVLEVKVRDRRVSLGIKQL